MRRHLLWSLPKTWAGSFPPLRYYGNQTPCKEWQRLFKRSSNERNDASPSCPGTNSTSSQEGSSSISGDLQPGKEKVKLTVTHVWVAGPTNHLFILIHKMSRRSSALASAMSFPAPLPIHQEPSLEKKGFGEKSTCCRGLKVNLYKNKTISNAVAWSGRFGLLERRPDPLFLRLKKIVFNSRWSYVFLTFHPENIIIDFMFL